MATISLGSKNNLLLSLVAINLFGHMAISGGRVASSLYALKAGLPISSVGLLIALYGLLSMFFCLPIGRWIDRSGPFLPMLLGIIAVTSGLLLPIVNSHPVVLLATAILCGTGFMMVALSAQHCIGNLFNEDAPSRITAFGWLALGHSTSGIVGPFLVGIIIDLGNFKTAFALLVVCAIISLLLVQLNEKQLKMIVMQRSPIKIHKVWTLINTVQIRRIYIVGILVAIPWDLFIFLMPILGHQQNLSASVIGSILSALALGTFSIRLITARWGHHFSEWYILRIAVVTIVVVYLALPLTTSAYLLFLLSFILGMAVGSSQPNMLSLLHTAAPPGRGAEAIGLRGTFANASGVIVPLLFGVTLTSTGALPIFWGVAAIVSIALPLAHKEAQTSEIKLDN